MKVIYTDHSRDSLEELTDFLLNEQGWSVENFLESRKKLIDKADSLKNTSNHY